MASVSTGLDISRPPRGSCASIALPELGEHGLGVELHALGRELAVADAHQHLARARGHLEAIRQLGVDHQRVVAAGHERILEALEDRLAVVLHLRPSCRAPAGRAPPCRRTPAPSAWWPRQTPSTGVPSPGESRGWPPRTRPPRRRARPGRHDHPPPRARSTQLVDRGGVIAHHLKLSPKLAQVLDEVVGEGVVVVDQQDSHGSSSG